MRRMRRNRRPPAQVFPQPLDLRDRRRRRTRDQRPPFIPAARSIRLECVAPSRRAFIRGGRANLSTKNYFIIIVPRVDRDANLVVPQ